jgi:hypothetical protein
MDTLNLSDIIHWFNALRNLPENQRYRALEGMWDTQLYSKKWIVDQLNLNLNSDIRTHNIYVFGGWIGILSSMLLQRSTFMINKIRSIDIDPWCEQIADTVCKPYEMDNWRFKAHTADMCKFEYESMLNPTIVINTSTEHVDQSVYNEWYDRIPLNTIVVAQGNNYFSCHEHVRCTESLFHFKEINNVDNTLYEGVLSNSMYERYMCIWKKQ